MILLDTNVVSEAMTREPRPRVRADGKGFPAPDGYIAAIAGAHGFAVASRDTSAFNAAGLTVIDPWTASR